MHYTILQALIISNHHWRCCNMQVNLDSKLQANPNLLFDMLGASEKIALLSRQNDALMLSNKMLEAENTQLQRELYSANEELGK